MKATMLPFAARVVNGDFGADTGHSTGCAVVLKAGSEF